MEFYLSFVYKTEIKKESADQLKKLKGVVATGGEEKEDKKVIHDDIKIDDNQIIEDKKTEEVEDKKIEPEVEEKEEIKPVIEEKKTEEKSKSDIKTDTTKSEEIKIEEKKEEVKTEIK